MYGCPTLNDTERNEYFTFNEAEIKALRSFKQLGFAVYFAISLAFFKLKYTLINFGYRDVTAERQHVMKRYFPNKATPRSFPTNKDVIARIENKVLTTVGFKRFSSKISDHVMESLQKQASMYPRQRQLCKAFSSKLTYEKKGYKILPSRTIRQNLIASHWEDILRFMVTIKLKHVSASQLFKRLSSYAKNNPLYKAIKEFGRIIKSLFILIYLDDMKRLCCITTRVICPSNFRHSLNLNSSKKMLAVIFKILDIGY